MENTNGAGSVPAEALRSARQAFNEAELEEHIRASRERCRRIFGSYRMGRLTDSELDSRLYAEAHAGFEEYVWNRDLEWRLSEAGWSRFLEERGLWREGKEPVCDRGAAWLVFRRGGEAGASDKAAFFRLMEAFCVPEGYFRPFREGGVRPNWHPRMYGTGMNAVIWFSLTDDGGFAHAEDPVGRTFTLTDDLGLRAEISVLRQVPEEANRGNNVFEAKYSGVGTIEGYTSERSRRIDISGLRGSRVSFWLSVGNDDLEAFNAFPMWEEYHRYVREKDRLTKARIEAMMDLCRGAPEEP